MVQLQLDFEQVVDLVEQLPEVQQQQLITRLLAEPIVQPGSFPRTLPACIMPV
jgi:hypothetical protein